MTDAEQISLKTNLKLGKSLSLNPFLFILFLVRRNVDQWLQTTREHNEQINIHDNLHNELNTFHKDFINSLNNPKLIRFFQQQINHIENILQEKQNHQKIFQQVQNQIIEIDQMINENKILQKKFHKYKEDFNQIRKQEDLEIQPIFRTRLELAIRTLNADLQLMEQILQGKMLTDIIPMTSLIATKISRQSIESQIYKDITIIRDNLSAIATNIKAQIDEKKTPQDLLNTDTVSRGVSMFYRMRRYYRPNVFKLLNKNIRNRK
jgi:hypothetical protein